MPHAEQSFPPPKQLAVVVAAGGMLRLLSWRSGFAVDKAIGTEMSCTSPLPPQKHVFSAMDLSNSPALKRKRTEPLVLDTFQSVKRRKRDCASLSSLPPTNHSSSSLETTAIVTAEQTSPVKSLSAIPRSANDPSPPLIFPPAPVAKAADRDALRQAIDTQIGLEILLKHNECRLIDQEIAKCQIALEQLRRCTEIPFPVSRPSQHVSHGNGPAARLSRSTTLATSPPPWGVADGPYSRHYARWLLPDPIFDGGEPPLDSQLAPDVAAGCTTASGRPIRGSAVDLGTSASKSRVQRAGKFHALSNGYPQPKDKNGPMIQKRKSDGRIVKLVCLDCRRENFSSAQGFINHCRIAHGRSFASHDAAADACGEPTTVDEVAKPSVPDTNRASPAGLVHPLVTSAYSRRDKAVTKKPARVTGITQQRPDPVKSYVADVARHHSAHDFTLSPTTPHLSAFLERAGARMNLQSLVADAKTPRASDEDSEDEVAEEEATPRPLPCHGRHPVSKGPNRARGLLSARKSSTAPSDVAVSKNMVLPAYAAGLSSDGIERSPTNDSTQAPSLIDDDGEDDFEAPSPFYPASSPSEGESHDVTVKIQDGDEAEPSSRIARVGAEYGPASKEHLHPSARQQRHSAMRQAFGGRGERHVSFLTSQSACEPELALMQRHDRGPGNDVEITHSYEDR